MRRSGAVSWAAGLCLAVLAAGPALARPPGAVAGADFSGVAASPDTRRLADWVVRSGDAHGRPFLIVDKAGARVFAFGPDGAIRGNSPVLLGLARGDVSPPGIGNRKLADIGPADRVTPAGRFDAEMGRNFSHDILWIDYDAAISLHRVVTGKPAERRLERLATATTLDNRISYGCINVPVAFYEQVVAALFRPRDGVVYVLPESRSFAAIFPAAAADPVAPPPP